MRLLVIEMKIYIFCYIYIYIVSNESVEQLKYSSAAAGFPWENKVLIFPRQDSFRPKKLVT